MQNEAQAGWQEEESFIDAAYAPAQEEPALAPASQSPVGLWHRAAFLAQQVGRWEEAAYFRSLLRTLSPVVLLAGPYGAAEAPACRQFLQTPLWSRMVGTGKTVTVLYRYGREPKAFLHFRPGLRGQTVPLTGITPPVREHMRRYAGQFVPPLAVPISRVAEYVTAAPFFQKIEWFLPSPLLKSGLRLMRPAETGHAPRALSVLMREVSSVVFCFGPRPCGFQRKKPGYSKC